MQIVRNEKPCRSGHRQSLCSIVRWLYRYLTFQRERSGSVVQCLTRDRGAAGSSLTGVTALCPWARHIHPSLVLVQPRKTCPYITERLLMGHIESNQTNKQTSKINSDLVSMIWLGDYFRELWSFDKACINPPLNGYFGKQWRPRWNAA